MQSITFNTPGTPFNWVVPANVTRIHVEASGAQGGEAGPNAGGLGGFAEADLFVCPGQELLITIGGAGGNANLAAGGEGGENGGGTGGSGVTGSGAGGGGGMTSLQIESVYALIAAGGGGSSASLEGGSGGGLEGDAGEGVIISGQGGTQVAGGTGGNALIDGEDGSQFNGGDGANGLVANSGGGGGGAGWFGGGGGAAQNALDSQPGAGGGGSSYVAGAFVIPGSFATESGVRPSDGTLTISWAPVEIDCRNQVAFSYASCQPVCINLGTNAPNARTEPPSGSRLRFGRHRVQLIVDRCTLCEFNLCVKQKRASRKKCIH